MSIFKAYDVRGVVPSELGAADAHRLGRATARHFGARRLVVGRDARSSSPELAGALVRGITKEGGDGVDIGCVATPMLYFAVEALGADGGVMVTASHNPAQYNGFKLCREHAIPVGEASGLREIEKLAADIAGQLVAPRPGVVRSEGVTARYVDHALAVGEQRPALRVAIDCGNGMAAVGLEPLLAAPAPRRGAALLRAGLHVPESPRRSAPRRESRGRAARGAADGRRLRRGLR